MKIINSLIIAVSVLGAGSAIAGEDPVQAYLVKHHLIDPPFESSEVVNRKVVPHMDPTTRYLSESGLIDAPHLRADTVFDEPAFAIDEDTRELLEEWGFLAS